MQLEARIVCTEFQSSAGKRKTLSVATVQQALLAAQRRHLPRSTPCCHLWQLVLSPVPRALCPTVFFQRSEAITLTLFFNAF